MKIIAEIGLNHCGSEKRADELLQKLVRTRIDAITFQIREKEFYDHTHPRKYELSNKFYQEAIHLVHKHHKSIGFAITQPEKIDTLKQYGSDFWKTLSWDLTNSSLLTSLENTGKKVYVSTGVSGIEEIVKVGKQFNNIEFIHTQLTDRLEDVNIKAIDTIRKATQKEVALGLHCQELKVMYVSLALQPSAIYFYVKDDTDGEHPDDAHAIKINDVDMFTFNLNKLAVCVGDGVKNSQESTLLPDDDPLKKKR